MKTAKRRGATSGCRNRDESKKLYMMTIENDEQNEDKRQVGLDMQRTKPHKMRSYALLQTATAWTEEQNNAVYNRVLLDKGSQR